MALLGLSSYIDVPTYLRSPHGLEVASTVGLNTTTTGTQVAGTTSLVVGASAGFVAALAYILDGPQSELVTITGSVDGTHVTLAAPGTAFAHAGGVSVSQAGAGSCLAEVILRASSLVESYCQQGTGGGDRSLYAVARTERWAMPSQRAYLDRDAVLAVNPGHFPVQSVASLAIEFGQGQSLSLDVTQLEQTTVGRTVELPFLLQTSPNSGLQLFLESRGISRGRRQWAVITYTGGVTAGALPYDVQQACALIVSDMLSQRLNPTGAAEVLLGKRTTVQRQRGDVTGDSILLLRAFDALKPYKETVFG